MTVIFLNTNLPILQKVLKKKEIKRIARNNDLTENDSAVASGNPSIDSIAENGYTVNKIRTIAKKF